MLLREVRTLIARHPRLPATMATACAPILGMCACGKASTRSEVSDILYGTASGIFLRDVGLGCVVKEPSLLLFDLFVLYARWWHIIFDW